MVTGCDRSTLIGLHSREVQDIVSRGHPLKGVPEAIKPA
jgi:hypothetical protein